MDTGVAQRLQSVRERMAGTGACLVAVSKFHPAASLQQAYDAGQRDFGESRAAELRDKAAALPGDIRWHFIGHLQTNKLKLVIPVASVIQSVDSERLALLIDAEAGRCANAPDLLLQVHVAAEETKTGFTPEELLDAAPRIKGALRHVKVTGLMGMATNTDDAGRVARDFRAIRELFDTLAATVWAGDTAFSTVSMGMSDDWPLAVGCGSNMIRVGTDIFGPREY